MQVARDHEMALSKGQLSMASTLAHVIDSQMKKRQRVSNEEGASAAGRETSMLGPRAASATKRVRSGHHEGDHVEGESMCIPADSPAACSGEASRPQAGEGGSAALPTRAMDEGRPVPAAMLRPPERGDTARPGIRTESPIPPVDQGSHSEGEGSTQHVVRPHPGLSLIHI